MPAEGGSASGGDSLSVFKVFGRGELHIAILLENRRREGYELQVSQPPVIIKEETRSTSSGHVVEKLEPFEEVTVDVPIEYQGIIIERLGVRAAVLMNHKHHEHQVRLTFEGPTRGLLGYRGQFIIDTKGEGIFASRVVGFRPHVGAIEKRAVGSMVSMIAGKTVTFALGNLQTRGVLYVGAGVDVYEGMVIGNTAKGEEMGVNPIKGKQLTNIRSAGADEKIFLVPPQEVTIER